MLNMLKQNTTGVVKLSFLKFLIGSLLFIATLAVYLADKDLIIGNIYSFQNPGAVLLVVIWLFFITEMPFRFSPPDTKAQAVKSNLEEIMLHVTKM